MTLALAESIGRIGRLDLADVMENFRKWMDEAAFTPTGEVFDMGLTCGRAIGNFKQGIPPVECGCGRERDNGNGSLMRIAPMAPFLYAKYGSLLPDKALEDVHDVSSLTHSHPRSQILTMIPNVHLPYFVQAPAFLPKTDALGFFSAACMIWWCFAGFEACVAMGEEIRFPRINIPRAMFLAPFVVFAVNALFQWYLIGITPAERLTALSTAEAPFAEAMVSAGILGFPLALLAAGIAFGGDFSTLNASISTPPRYLFSMARDGSMPKVFAKTNRFQCPYVAVATLGVLTVALIATNSLMYIASLSLFADLFYYVIGIIAAWALRRRHPELERPYRAPAIAIGAPVSALIYIAMMTQLDRDAFVTGIIWCVIGIAIYFVCSRRYGRGGEFSLDLKASGAADLPDPKERAAMDREYRIWVAVVAAACVLALALFILPYIVC